MKECTTYCVQDVNILRQSFEKFRGIFLKDHKVDCLFDCSTIAALSFMINKMHFMPENTLAHIGRTDDSNYSYDGVKWLTFMEMYKGQRIEHARNGGERKFKIKNRYLKPDGYVEIPTEDYVPFDLNEFLSSRQLNVNEQMIELNNRRPPPPSGTVMKKIFLLFHGCVWHGHQACKKGLESPHGKSSLDRYSTTMRQESDYKSQGYEVIRIWECEWAKMKKECEVTVVNTTDETRTEKLGRYVQSIGNELANAKLEVGEALYGGRTEPFVYYYPPTEGVQLKYLDFTSLYPFVQKTKPFPSGTPTKLVGRDLPSIEKFAQEMNSTYFGLSYVSVLPPKNLYTPVLPARYDNRLIFSLCRTCSACGYEGKCRHTDNQRMLKGVYCSPELELAVKKGYEIKKIHEIWKFTPSNDIFGKYVETFLKWKTEASGLPDGITDKDCDEFLQYLQDFKDIEGVTLDPSNIESNPGMRYIAKLLLNSLWGKLAQRIPKNEDIICSSYAQVWELMKRADLKVRNITVAGDKHIVEVTHTDFTNKTAKATNVAVASFTTAYARVELYNLLDSLGQRVLYCDTDSCVFTARKGQYIPDTGKFLGNLTDEIGSGEIADSFVCTGPKSYAIRIKKNDSSYAYILKAKGLTLNKDTEHIVNFQGMAKINFDKMIKDVEKTKNREWMVLNDDNHFYNMIKDTDVTALAVTQMMSEDGESSLHNDIHNLDDSAQPYVNNETHYREVRVPDMKMRANKVGNVTLINGIKRFRHTSNKRNLVLGSCLLYTSPSPRDS